MNNLFNKKFIGFTLIELMIALAILAIITTIAITQYNAYLKKVAISTATSLTDNIKARVMLYYADQEQFPSKTNGNATEINNNFNINALDANTKKIISNIGFYAKSDPDFPPLPISVTANFNTNYNLLGYIQIDFNPAQKLYTDPSAPAQLFLVAFEVNSSMSLNNNINNIYDNAPKIVLASDTTPEVVWRPIQANLATSIPGATIGCSGNQVMRSIGCSSCDPGTYTDVNTATCIPCPTGQHAHDSGALQCDNCAQPSYASQTGTIDCTPCGTGVATCDPISGGARTCITAAPPASYTLQGPAGQAGTTCRVSCSARYYANTGNSCSACPPNCAACTSDTACSSCNSGFYGTICDGQCSPGCITCTSGTNCTACNTGSGYYLYNNACTQSCPAGTYRSGSSCVACPGGQWSAGGTATNCNPCYTGAVTGSCTATSNTACATNASPSGNVCYCGNNTYWNGSSCTACYTGAVTGSCTATSNTACATNASPTGTVCYCGNNTYWNGSSCTACYTGAITGSCTATSNTACAANASSSGTTCTCNGGYTWNGSSCVVNCPAGTTQTPGGDAIPGYSQCYCPSSASIYNADNLVRAQIGLCRAPCSAGQKFCSSTKFYKNVADIKKTWNMGYGYVSCANCTATYCYLVDAGTTYYTDIKYCPWAP